MLYFVQATEIRVYWPRFIFHVNKLMEYAHELYVTVLLPTSFSPVRIFIFNFVISLPYVNLKGV